MSTNGPDDLGERIAKAQGQLTEAERAAEAKRGANLTNSTGMALRYSAELVAAVLVGLVLGLALDHFVGTSPWGMIGGMILGILAGMRNVIRAANKLTRDATMTDEPTGSDNGKT